VRAAAQPRHSRARSRAAAAARLCTRHSRGASAAAHAAAARRGGIQQPGCAGSQPGAKQWGPRRGRRAAALRRRLQGWDKRQAGRCAHGAGMVGQGRASGPGFLQRLTGATAGSRRTRPRGSQGAHAGAWGVKMRVIFWRVQRAYFRRNRRAGSRATSVAVRHQRRVHAQLHFSAVFHTKTLPVWADRASEGSLASKPMRGDKTRVFW